MNQKTPEDVAGFAHGLACLYSQGYSDAVKKVYAYTNEIMETSAESGHPIPNTIVFAKKLVEHLCDHEPRKAKIIQDVVNIFMSSEAEGETK